MTREEAIIILGDYEYILFEDEDTYNREAFRMAIKALSQEQDMTIAYLMGKYEDKEPCDDAISREAAITIAGTHTLTVDETVKAIKNLPSVTQKSGKWISVSERLPEDAYGCLVTVYDTDLRTQDEFENILPYFVGYDGETWNNFCGEPIPFEVIAWMPLPKPYEPQESESDA